MARPLRIEYPGAFYHVYSRGLERREIFRDRKDYEKFLSILTEVWKTASFICHSYCLMPNHDHFYLETPLGNLSKIMQEVNGRYTQYFNKRYKRVGPLFQGRYKAKLIDHDSYSLQVSRYIHLNPVKAKLVKHPSRWEWSSMSAFMGQAKRPEFLETKWLMSQVGSSRRKFEKYTMAGLKDGWSPLESSGRGPVMGTDAFIEKVKLRIQKQAKDGAITGLRELRKGDGVKELERAVKRLRCNEKLKRKLMMYGWRKYTDMSLKDVCARLQASSPVAVSQAVRRFEKEAASSKKIKTLVKEIRMSIVKP